MPFAQNVKPEIELILFQSEQKYVEECGRAVTPALHWPVSNAELNLLTGGAMALGFDSFIAAAKFISF
jgi:hypothetical protein